MATLNSALRSYSAAVKRAERSQQRRAREAAKMYRLQAKQQEITNAATAVAEYEEYVDILKSVHKEVSETIDWHVLKAEPQPIRPVRTNHHEQKAMHGRESYKPSFTDKLFGLKDKKIKKLDDAVLYAIAEDRNDFDKAIEGFKKDLQDWDELQKISRGVLAKETAAYKNAIVYFDPFGEIKELGSQVNIAFQSDYSVIDLVINNDSVIPKHILTATSTGKLSKKNMPVSKFNELYQDYICSCVLRIARETCAYLPVKFVIINALGELLNSSNGNLESTAILSVVAVPATLDKINFNNIDPSDSLRNFVHNMKFSKTNGFAAIDRINPDTIHV